MKAIYRFLWDCGRMGNLHGLFIANKLDVDKAIGKEIDFGEALGKHSEIVAELELDDLTELTDDQDFIRKFESIMGTGTISGHNPIERYLELLEDEYYDEDEE